MAQAFAHFGLAAAAVLALSAPSLAAPPAIGSVYTFLDPVFEGTIVCDTFEQVAEIAGAAEPEAAYAAFMVLANDIGDPTCLAITPTAEVRAVTSLGTLQRQGQRFAAWAVEADVEGTTIFALYLEARTEILV